MSKREFRRRCGLALGMLLSWQGYEAYGDDAQPAVASDEPSTVVELASEPSAEPTLTTTGAAERVLERYPNRVLKVERFVAQDAAGNFINHGSWAKWSEDGRLLGKGEFVNGAQHGKWIRLFTAEETQAAFAGSLALGFECAVQLDGRVLRRPPPRNLGRARRQEASGQRHGVS